MPRKVPEAEFRAVYEEWCQGSLSQKAAAARLGMSDRTFRRYAAGLRAQGSQWWEQRSRPRPASYGAPDEERESLQRLYSDHYAGCNARHFHEKYRGEHGGERSYTWVKNELQAAGLLERRTRGGTGTAKRVQSRGDHQSVDRMPREGMLLHQIAARHEWTAGGAWDLILTADDATNRVHSGFFVEKRGIWSIFRGIRETLERKGTFDGLNVRVSLPARLTATDSAFGGSTADQLTRIISDVCPQEWTEAEICTRQVRLIGTLRGRLPRELATKGIAEIDSANEFLAGFWPEFNASSGNTTGTPSVFQPLSRDMVAGLVDVLCLKHDARIDSRNRLFCRGREVRIPRRARQHLSGDREYRVHEYEDGSWKVLSRGGTGPGRLKWEELTSG